MIMIIMIIMIIRIIIFVITINHNFEVRFTTNIEVQCSGLGDVTLRGEPVRKLSRC
jgi:hypothetical protein